MKIPLEMISNKLKKKLGRMRTHAFQWFSRTAREHPSFNTYSMHGKRLNPNPVRPKNLPTGPSRSSRTRDIQRNRRIWKDIAKLDCR